MAYVYVNDVYDDHYVTPPPKAQCLNRFDVPEEEMEIREILDCWYEQGLVPLRQTKLSPTTFWTQTHNFKRLSRTLNTLIRHRAYYCAVQRVSSLWVGNSLEKQYVDYLLTRNQS
ncbi:hypothetical protein VHP8226_01151 [Vibrio hippocampi]|uniref:Uncharacterized protein n=1 Tax=Vibrio hippocampi TaxID=654686 RepID=A0ABM8ZG94_9VIBR|nr:hypothetical protein VHP8226_01151 [Vibrio hippocampi]